MFKSATLRLTGWYLLILMSLSIVFSVVIYQVASSEVQTRLEQFETNLQESQEFIHNNAEALALRTSQLGESRINISFGLLYVNFFVLTIGGFGSYFLARRNISPIEKAHENQSRFTSDASHELRTPLAVMKAEIEVALMNPKSTAKDLKEVLVSNLEEVDKLSKLSQMLLDLSRFDNAKFKLGTVNLYKVSHNIVKDFKLPSNRILINSKKHPMIHSDETAITELVRVLIDNALQYSPKDSQIVINISKTDSQAQFEIINTGPGISADKLPYVFDRFYRADSSRTKGAQKGYGLGLALAKRIVELHNGELTATSTPDHETIFTFILPLN